MQDKLAQVCAAFRIEGTLDSWEELKIGNINKTYKVTYAREMGPKKTYIVQRVNTFVFKSPENVMENIDLVTRHLRMEDPGRVNLHYHHTRDGKNFIRDGEAIWRLFNFVPSAVYSETRDETLVRNAGFAFGEFQEMLSRFNASLLHETIPDFHNTEKRYEALDEINQENGTDYTQKDVYFVFKPEIPTNAQENAQIELTEAQKRQTDINTVLNLRGVIDDETMLQLICEQLDIDYNDIKDKLPTEEPGTDPAAAQTALANAPTEPDVITDE